MIKEQLAALHATRAAESTKRDQALGAVTRRAEVLAQDAERLQRLNRDLAGKLDKTTAELTRRRQAQVKPPPSLRTVWAKLRHHRFYVPFWTKVVLNTLGLRGRKASRRA